MPALPALSYPYPGSGELHPNLILGIPQLLGWLVFHPAAWRAYVARLDPHLAPSFGLLDLRVQHWRHPLVWRLLLQVYLVLPLFVGLVVGITLFLLNHTIPVHMLILSMTLSIIGSLFISLELSVACVALSVLFGMVWGIFAGLMSGFAGGFIFGRSFAQADQVDPSLFLWTSLAIGMVSGLLMGSTRGTAALLANSRLPGSHSAEQLLPTRLVPSATQRMMRITMGVVLTSLAGAVVFTISFSLGLAGDRNVSRDGLRIGLTLLGAIGFGGALGWIVSVLRAPGRPWGPAVLLGMVLGAAASIPVPLVGQPYRVWDPTVPVGLLFGVLIALTNGIPIGIILTLFYVTGHRLSSVQAGASAAGLSGGVAWLLLLLTNSTDLSIWLPILLGGLGVLGGWLFATIRPVLLFPLEAMWSVVLYQLELQNTGRFPSLWRRQAAFWDEFQRLPLPRLDDHLLLVMERDPAAGTIMSAALSTGHQRWAIRAAQLELDARRLEQCHSVETIAQIHRGLVPGELDSPTATLLRSFGRISHDIDAALQQESTFNQRLTLRTTEGHLYELLRELNRSNEAYVARFRPIALHWHQIVVEYSAALAQAAELRQEIDSPYIIGVPLNEQQEIFVGRTDITARLERVLLEPRSQPLLLYGQRRMGKTSLLNNLGRLLPSGIVPFFVDLQGPASRARDEAGFLYNLARGMSTSAQRHRGLTLPPLARETLTADPYTAFDEWYDAVEAALTGQTALLILDEFEVLEPAFAEERFKAANILGMFRYMLQHRPHFKILVAGSHVLDELQSWSSYLINVQVIKLGYLQEVEACQLIERPVKGFALVYEPAAVQRVLELTRGHPFLLQLLCAEIVAHKNQHESAQRWLPTPLDVEVAVPAALHHGSFFFGDLERNQLSEIAVAVLGFLAAQGENAVVPASTIAAHFPTLRDQALPMLLRRDVIEPYGDGYRVQVELIRRWFDRPAA